MADTVVDKLYGEFQYLGSSIDRAQPSLQVIVDGNFRKAILLAAASYFEHRVTNDILFLMGEMSNRNQLIVELIRITSISRKYHTLFNWNDTNANQFFALFGTEFKTFMQGEVKSDADLDTSVKAFMEIGRDRNRLVHQDYASFSLEKTAEEIYELYKVALRFVNAIPDKMRQFILTSQNETEPPQQEV